VYRYQDVGLVGLEIAPGATRMAEAFDLMGRERDVTGDFLDLDDVHCGAYDCSGHFVRGLVASVFISLRRDRQLGTATTFNNRSRSHQTLDGWAEML
jgi:hypothetical protein